MTLFTELDAYQALRRSHRSQIEPRLAELHETIAQQLQSVNVEEQRLLEAQRDAIAQLQSMIASDVRCLLSEPTFHAQIVHWLST